VIHLTLTRQEADTVMQLFECILNHGCLLHKDETKLQRKIRKHYERGTYASPN